MEKNQFIKNRNVPFSVNRGLRLIKKVALCLVYIVLFCIVPCYSQTLSKEITAQIVQKLANELIENYPFPEISARYSAGLLKNLSEGVYSNLSESSLASRLSSDLSNIHRDVHLVVFSNEELFKSLTVPQNSDAPASAETQSLQRSNYGFKSVELDALTATAYINIPGPFYARQEAFETAAAAMNLAAYSKYVIIDLRANGGGSGEMGRFLASYFYEAGNEKFYLNGFFKDRTKDVQEWTYSFVPGRRNPTAKVYILVGGGTASAAEGFAYAMQQLNRATIVGDTTAGAGIAGTYAPLGNNLVAFLPFKMVVAPNTNTGWEGIGVIPDSLTDEKDALAEVRQMILKEVLKAPASSEEREVVEWLVDEHEAEKSPTAGLKNRYIGLAGKYNNNLSITYANFYFVWNRTEPGKATQRFSMKEVKPDVFTIIDLNKDHGMNSSRVYINRNLNGKIQSLTRKTLLKNGTIYTTLEAFKPL